MTTPEKTAVASHAAIILLCGVVAFCCIELVNTLDKTLDGVNVSLKTINMPKSGTLSMLDDTIYQGRLTIDATNHMLIHEQTQLTTMDADLARVTGSVNTTLAALSGTAQTASRSIQDATDHLTPVLDAATSTTLDVGTATRRLLPIEDDADASVKHFDALVTSKDVTRFLNSTAKTSEQVAGIATDLHKATTDATKPQPWWRKALGYGNLGVNIACLATHSCPF